MSASRQTWRRRWRTLEGMRFTIAPPIRPPMPEDRCAIEEMWERCSPVTRFFRLHSPSPSLPKEYLDAVCADPSASRVCADASSVRGLGSMLAALPGVGDLGVVVEDSWQQRGVGSGLVASLIAGAPARGITVVTATVQTERAWLAQALRRLPGECHVALCGPTLQVWVELDTAQDVLRTGDVRLLRGDGEPPTAAGGRGVTNRAHKRDA
jgi:hypothetical protein